MLRFLNNRPSNNRKQAATPPQPAGLAKPAEFAQPQPGNPPTPPPAAAQATGHFYANHHSFLAYLNDLLKAGHSPQEIQAKWQQYYDNLTDLEKETVWRQVNNRPAQASPLPVQSAPAQAHPAPPAAVQPGVSPAPPPQAAEEEALPAIQSNAQSHKDKAIERLRNFRNRRFSGF